MKAISYTFCSSKRNLFIGQICLSTHQEIDMERLIADMMIWANVTEDELKEKKEIQTTFGETLSWATTS